VLDRRALKIFLFPFIIALALHPKPVQAEDILCDPAFENCRDRLLDLIRREQVSIDVAFWFMEDARYTTELIRRHQAGVQVRVLVDPRANASTPVNADRLNELAAAGIPMRKRVAAGILHWKMMLFGGLETIEFSAANYSPWALTPVAPYQNYTDEAIYFTDDDAIVNSFRTKFDSLWINTTQYANYANITTPLTRTHGIFTKDPELNFPPSESYRSRAVSRYNAETAGIDVIMYRVTDRAHSDAMIRARQRGLPVRLLTEPQQYRDAKRHWHSWNVDRMYMAGVQIRHRAHEGLNHQKTVILRSQRMTIFGSSNWSSASSDEQDEHNYFTVKPYFYDWFSAQFDRKWNNTAGFAESGPFVPLPPDKPTLISPENLATNQGTASMTFTWHAGLWAHVYDVYLGTTPDPPFFATAGELGPSETTTDYKRFTVTGLQPGTTYYWRIVSKTMANMSAASPVRTFTTAGSAPPPPPSGSGLGPGDVLMYASKGTVAGNWRVVSDPQAAGGSRLSNPDAGLAKLATAFASPADYFELQFNAEAGKPYRLWIRGIAQNNYFGNDSIHVQFSGSVTAGGSPTWRIGTTDATQISIEDNNGAGLSGWGWQDNGWGGLGPEVYFAETGQQTIRIQRREDGISVDQILLSPSLYLTSSPGATKNDTTIFLESDGGDTGGGEEPPPPPPPPSSTGDVILYASGALITGGDWRVGSDVSAAGGMLMQNPDAGRAKVVTALATPASYIELTFTAQANVPYRLWLRARAQNDYWGNDSVHVQFSNSVDANGAALYRIGTTSAASVNLEDCSNCGVSGWGWQDNGYGAGVLGPLVYFPVSGTQTLRIQAREDGVSIDQIVLSPTATTFLNSAPGALKSDSTILPRSGS
jgi:phosphatidylserine/phosphatidylglycerophosphate/cardiolipin synthase-like enzyme